MPEEKALIDPYATEQDEAALKALDEEIAQAAASLESDFAKFAASKVDEKTEELFFEDKEEFFKQVCAWQNEFLSGFREKQGKAKALSDEIGLKKSFKAIENAKNEFAKNHPEVNTNELMDFYANDLSPRIKANLDKLEPREFFEALFIEFSKQNGSTQSSVNKEQNEALPKRINGSEADINSGGEENEAYFNRF